MKIYLTLVFLGAAACGLATANVCDAVTNVCSGATIEVGFDHIPYEQDLRDLIVLNKEYVIFEKLWTDDILQGLYKDGLWLEENAREQFVQSNIKRNVGDHADGDLANYHRVSSIFWLTFLKPEHLPHIPYLVKYREWISVLKEAINRQLPEEWEVS